MAEILISTGALIGRPNGRDYRLLLPLSKQLECDGYEFMMYSTWYDQVDDIVSFLKSSKLYTPVFHCQKSIGESISKGGEEELEDAFCRFEVNAGMASQIGAGKMVMHLWDGITSDQNFENNLNAYEKLRGIAQRYGVELLVENVVCNREDPMKHWCELAQRYPDIHFIFDTKMAAFHGQLELLYAKDFEWLRQENHIHHFHVNDYAGGLKDWENLRTLPIGSGHVDFDRFFAFIRQMNYDGTYTLESTAFDNTGAVDVEMLNRQVRYIREKIA